VSVLVMSMMGELCWMTEKRGDPDVGSALQNY
jgi:hypothetical protein